MSTNKSFSNETSERYSRALFEVAKESKELDKLEDDVKKLQSIFNSCSEINNFIKCTIRKIRLIKKYKKFFFIVNREKKNFLCKKNFGKFSKFMFKK